MPSLHILIATIGRHSLQTMLDSILPFLSDVDHLTIVFDGVEPTQLNTETKGTVHIYHEPVALGYWGHGVRNKYAAHLEKTDFVMHGDDDDSYAPDAFDAIRSACIDPNTLYMMKVYNVTRNTYLPAFPKIENRNISTQCGVIPYELNVKGTWGPFYGGDFAFYESIEPLAPVVFIDSVIYLYNCPWH
jgi:hypothetical protein